MINPRPITDFKFTQEEYDLFINDIEFWRVIENHPDYLVSTFGNFKSNKIHSKGNYLYPDTAHNGYLRVTFCENGKAKKEPAHRIVAQAFVCNPENKPQINHDSGVKIENFPNNLYWCTQGENNSHAYRTGLSKGSAYGKKGKLSACSKPIAQYSKSGLHIANYDSITLASESTGVDVRRICDNALGTKPGGGGFDWRYI